MKGKTIRTLIVALTLAAASLVVTAEDRKATVLLQSGIAKETIQGDLKGAVADYESAVKEAGANRALTAKVLLRLGEAYQKLGEQKAKSVFERLANEFSDQKDAAAQAQTWLAGMRGTPASNSGIRTHLVWGATPRQGFDGSNISPDGRFLAYYEQNVNLFLRDLATGTSRQLTNARTGEYPEEYCFSKDGKQIAYNWHNGNGRYEVRVVSLQGAELPQPVKLFDNPDVPWILPHDWSPDGKWIAVSLNRGVDKTSQIALLSVADGSLRVLKSFAWNSPTSMFFSPDGKYLTYDLRATDSSFQRDVFLLAVDGTREIPAVVHPADDIGMGWSPDGKHLLFMSDRTNGSRSLWALAFADGKPQGAPQLIKRDLGQAYPLGTMNSGSVVFKLENEPSSNIHVIDFDFSRDEFLGTSANELANSNDGDWSRDGKFLAYQTFRPDTGMGTQTSAPLAIRSLETGQVRELYPNLSIFTGARWSPDGESLAVGGIDFRGRTGVHRIDTTTGEVSPLAIVPCPIFCKGVARGLSPQWSPDGSNIYYTLWNFLTKEAVFAVRNIASGKETEILRRNYGNLGTVSLSPDGRYLATAADGRILLIPTAGGEPRVMRGGADVLAWAPDSQSILILSDRGSQGSVWRVPLEGQAHRINFDVRNLSGPLRVHPDGRRIAFTVAAMGESKPVEIWALDNFLPTLNASTVSGAAGKPVQLAWFDRTGKQLETVGTPGRYNGLDLSPDGKRIAIHRNDGNGGDIWTFHERGAASRLTFDTDATQNNSMPVWSPDGTRIVFGSFRNTKWGLYVKHADGTGTDELLLESEVPLTPMSWSTDGNSIIYCVRDPKTGADQWLLPLSGDRKTTPLMTASFNEGHGQISPDGKWIAYDSNETGRGEVYIKPFPNGPGRWQVSKDGGQFPRWRGDGKELYFLRNPGTTPVFNEVMAAEIRVTGSSIQHGAARPLFDSGYDNSAGGRSLWIWHAYTVSPDGQRFLIPRPVRN